MSLYKDSKVMYLSRVCSESFISLTSLISSFCPQLANILFTREQARLVPSTNLTANALSPGFLPGTGLSRNQGQRGQWFMKYVMANLPLSFVASLEDAGNCVEHVATSPLLEGVSGK